VDENRNCEDIAMQFLASNLTGKPPIFVRGRVTDLGVFKGISTKSWTRLGHMKSRGQCLNDFVDLYGGVMPLVKGRVVAGSASSWVFNRCVCAGWRWGWGGVRWCAMVCVWVGGRERWGGACSALRFTHTHSHWHVISIISHSSPHPPTPTNQPRHLTTRSTPPPHRTTPPYHHQPPPHTTPHHRPSSIFEYISSDMLVGGSGKGKTYASVRRARLLHLVPLLGLLVLVICKLMY
jgi:hypothetical protein